MNKQDINKIFEQAKKDNIKYREKTPIALQYCMSEFVQAESEHPPLLSVLSILTTELTKAVERIEELENKSKSIGVEM